MKLFKLSKSFVVLFKADLLETGIRKIYIFPLALADLLLWIYNVETSNFHCRFRNTHSTNKFVSKINVILCSNRNDRICL